MFTVFIISYYMCDILGGKIAVEITRNGNVLG
jgi:hypothetical protein